MDLCRIIQIKEVVPNKSGEQLGPVVERAGVIVIIENPFLNVKNSDLAKYSELGEQIGDLVMVDLRDSLSSPACCYGKAALIGTHGSKEHGAAIIHPTLGKPIRAALGGGAALIPSNVKVGAPGVGIDVPLSHKDDTWSFDHLDTMTISVADAPKSNEIMVIIALSTSTRVG